MMAKAMSLHCNYKAINYANIILIFFFSKSIFYFLPFNLSIIKTTISLWHIHLKLHQPSINNYEYNKNIFNGKKMCTKVTESKNLYIKHLFKYMLGWKLFPLSYIYNFLFFQTLNGVVHTQSLFYWLLYP